MYISQLMRTLVDQKDVMHGLSEQSIVWIENIGAAQQSEKPS